MGAVSRMLRVLAGAAAAPRATGAPPSDAPAPQPNCDAKFEIAGGHGSSPVLIPTGWKSAANGYSDVLVEKGAVLPQMGARAYFADKCTAGTYNNTHYMRANLLGKTLKFSTDLAGAGCGCNAALYMTSMGHNRHASECFDHYCDANNVCGQSCAEIDIMEANQHAWHSTLHTKTDSDGAASGFGGGGPGWSGPRNWTVRQYGIGGSCIDTARPFQVSASFPIDKHGILEAMQITLSQEGHGCRLHARVDDYARGKKELTHALVDGMTPIVSYWADDDMLWMDGRGDDREGPCKKDSAKKCAASVRFWNFSIEDLDDKEMGLLEAEAKKQDRDEQKRAEKKAKAKRQADAKKQLAKKQAEAKKQLAGTDERNHQGTVERNDQGEGSQKVEDWGEQWGSQGGQRSSEGDQESQEPAELRTGAWASKEDIRPPSEGDWGAADLMVKDEARPGGLRGTAGHDGPRLAVLVGATAGAGAMVAAAVAVALRRLQSTGGGEGGVSAAGAGGANPRWRRGSFGSSGTLGALEVAAGAPAPAPMLQQPPSSQNLLAGGGLTAVA